MKIETLKKSHKKQIIIGAVAVTLIGAAIAFTTTRAKYRTTQSINIAKGTINYTVPDLRITEIKISNDGTNYTNTDEVPLTGYTLNTDKSICKVGDTEDSNIKIEYTDGKLNILGVTQKNTKCSLYFDKYIPPITKDDIIAWATNGSTSFTGISTTNEGIKTGTDDDGTTYYYRGAVTNNWVKFANMYWRIIRINGDGTIRMIYTGDANLTNVTVSGAVATGIGTQISNNGGTTTAYAFNTTYNDNAYIGYMYGSTGATSYSSTHANNTSSTIKTALDNWYAANLNKTGIKEHIDTNARFCNDRSVASSSQTWWSSDTKKGYGTNVTAYGPFSRAQTTSNSWNTTQTPTFKCSQTNDLFTPTSSTKGNKKLQYPVGLITMDEVIYAGGFGVTANNSYYLYTNQYYWTMSPNQFSGGNARVFLVHSNGGLRAYNVGGTWGVRPVINLKADTKFVAGGNGTSSNPYVVQ